MATSAPETTTKCKAKMNPNDKQGELEAENAKICELLRATFLCLGPLTKVCLKAVDALRKSQAKIYFQKGCASVKPLTPEQTKVIDDCHKICMEYQKMEVDSETFFAYLCSGIPPGIYMNKKQRKKEKAKLRRRNKRSPQQLPLPAEDVESTFLGWKETTERMFEIYEKLTAMHKSLVDIIQAVDPSKKTGLAQIFKSPELDRILDEIARLTQTLSSSDLAALCGCGCLQSLVAKLTLAEINRKKNCICSSCGLDMLQVEAAQAKAAAAAKTSTNNDNQKKQDERMVECKFVVRMSQEEKQEQFASTSNTKNLNKKKHQIVEWDYSEMELDYDTMNVSMTSASGVTSDPDITDTLQTFFSTGVNQNQNNTKVPPGFTIKTNSPGDLAELTVKMIKNLKAKDEGKSDLGTIKQNPTISQILQKKDEEEFSDSDSSTLQDEYDEEEGLETVWVEDKATQTDFVYSDSEIEILDESVVKLCIRDPKGVVKARKVPVRKNRE